MEKELLHPQLLQAFANYPGKYYLKYEQEQLSSVITHIYGYYLVQLAPFDLYQLKSLSTIPKHVYLGRNLSAADLSIIESSLTELPFQFESVDLFILPHTLEYSADPEKLLADLYHSLIPGGKVILFGFNPISFIGLYKLVALKKNALTQGNLYRLGQIKAWLQNCGFSIETEKTFCFRPPVKSEKRLKQLFFLETFGESGIPLMGSVYMLLAEKKAATLLPVRKKVFAKKVPVTAGFPEPSVNQ